MSTRAFVAVPYGDSWRGRHTHWDGYPTSRARELWALVRHDGLKTVRRVLTEDYAGWSTIGAGTPDITGVRANANASYGTAARHASQFRGKYPLYDSKRFVNVPGYGVAYSSKVVTFNGQKNYQQCNPDQWITPEDSLDTEWGYVLATDGLWVLKCHGGAGYGPPPTLIGVYRWDEPEPNWQEVEDKANEREEVTT